MSALAIRTRLRRLRRPWPLPPPAPPPPPPVDWARRGVPVQDVEAQPVTERQLARLRPEDVAAVEARFDADTRALWERSPPAYRHYLTLCLGVWLRVPGVLERTGLTPDEPPPEVHAMGRGALAAGGDHYTADLVMEAVARSGGDPAAVRRALDFGCSSGRVVRPLAAAFPAVEWHGVDPNGPAVAWAAAHVPQATFAPSASEPPLAFPDQHFDLVYAISIWSHFAEGAARTWLREMRRVVAPGGRLVLTIHGPQSVAHYGQRGERPPQQLEQIAVALHRHGFWYAPEFGAEGDFGVVHPEWGTAFMTLEWLARQVTPDWHVASYAVGRNAGNQDVVVLRRC